MSKIQVPVKVDQQVFASGGPAIRATTEQWDALIRVVTRARAYIDAEVQQQQEAFECLLDALDAIELEEE